MKWIGCGAAVALLAAAAVVGAGAVSGQGDAVRADSSWNVAPVPVEPTPAEAAPLDSSWD
ncbi:hypothetical protein OG883_00365 [Streptomyces sp. NBC_01142]|uniref:hypothetical protein n=1 Tax=Streptomyces sp. NBC_01142 TaxID=2975865 RepID=UPI00225B8684|nr:hypothetical protein [Streptomyces sp. NBC_01142]MCX4818385.1 hypothetical protein [Streptomyces sp. NBC_01142]